jgi:hypothetical protein
MLYIASSLKQQTAGKYAIQLGHNFDPTSILYSFMLRA